MNTLYVERNPSAWDITPELVATYFGFDAKSVVDILTEPSGDYVTTKFILRCGAIVKVTDSGLERVASAGSMHLCGENVE